MPPTVKSFLSSKQEQIVGTPDWLLQAIKIGYQLGDGYFDPCPLNPTFDGLAIPWHACNYVNPPYGNIEPWIRKAVEEMKQNRKSVFLIPFRPHTKYWVELVVPHACEVSLLREQIKFVGYRKQLPLALALVVFDPSQSTRQCVTSLGPISLQRLETM